MTTNFFPFSELKEKEMTKYEHVVFVNYSIGKPMIAHCWHQEWILKFNPGAIPDYVMLKNCKYIGNEQKQYDYHIPGLLDEEISILNTVKITALKYDTHIWLRKLLVAHIICPEGFDVQRFSEASLAERIEQDLYDNFITPYHSEDL